MPPDSFQNTTIEKRVTLLELHIIKAQDDMEEVQVEVVELNDEIAFVFDEVASIDDEQVQQNDRVFILKLCVKPNCLF